MGKRFRWARYAKTDDAKVLVMRLGPLTLGPGGLISNILHRGGGRFGDRADYNYGGRGGYNNSYYPPRSRRRSRSASPGRYSPGRYSPGRWVCPQNQGVRVPGLQLLWWLWCW